MRLFDLWPAAALIAATLGTGVAAGFVAADTLTLRDMRRTARQTAATPDRPR